MSYCVDWRSEEEGSPLCYADAVVEAYFDGEWRPVCAEHAKRHEARRVPETAQPPSWDEEIGVYLENGTKLFSINGKGEVYVHDHDCIPEAAVIFFREVAKVAELQGWTVDRASDRHGAQ